MLRKCLEKGLVISGQRGKWEAWLSSLSLKQVENWVAEIFSVSSQAVSLSSNELDAWLTLVMTLEEGQLFQPEAILSQDLAILESHHQGGLHGHYFKPSADREMLSTLLAFEGYRSDFMKLPLDVGLAYWLARKMTQPWPWTAMLKDFPLDLGVAFPFVARLQRFVSFLEQTDLPKVNFSQPSREELLRAIQFVQTDLEPQLKRISKDLALTRPVSLLVLVEGATEELLLPAIADVMGISLPDEGVEVLSVGGKSQMLTQLTQAIETLSVPVVILLDKDAEDLVTDLTYYKREQDQVLLLDAGEIEDTYSPELILETLKTAYPEQWAMLSCGDEIASLLKNGHVAGLEKLWHDYGLGRFNKVAFASALRDVMLREKRISPAMTELMQRILSVRLLRSAPFRFL